MTRLWTEYFIVFGKKWRNSLRKIYLAFPGGISPIKRDYTRYQNPVTRLTTLSRSGWADLEDTDNMDGMKMWRCGSETFISTTLGLSLTFPNYDFGKGQYAFTPWNYLVSPKKSRQMSSNYKCFQTPFDQQRFSIVTLFWRVPCIQTSWLR